ncbi:hypothetical protein DPMN_054432 [Dreissena polymorpha]|uniref:Uncharacterized protein n=1 Tax=Dreissena polymorpha TaxID=45954 RepID=A0A9D4CN46_DREPO|nr:hypothetical protein DPMN_054432 [Dreissena polymorpha]
MPSGHMQETPRQSATLPENLPVRRGIRKRFLYGLRRCQDRLSSCRRLSDGAKSLLDCQGTFRRIPEVCYGAKIVWSPARYTKTVCDGANTVSSPAGDFQTVFDGARQSLRPEGHLQETPRQSATVSRP